MRYTAEQQKSFFNETKKYLAVKNVKDLAAKDIGPLEELVRFHEYRYYVLNDPLVSDYEYDQLFKLLESAEEKFPKEASDLSPTKRVSSDLTEDFATVKHLVPMLSLENSYNEEDLTKFDTQVKKLTETDKINYTVEPKYDGGSIALIYEDDLMVRAATRGNGVEGEEVTVQAKTIRSLPLRAAFSSKGIFRAELRGEAVIAKERFKHINNLRADEGLPLLANPRNSAAGGLRTKDPSETARRQLDVFIFQLAYAVDKNGRDMLPFIKSHHDATDLLGDLGFKVSKGEKKLCKGIKEVMQQVDHWTRIRDDYPYEIDGMVVKVDDFDLQDMCGYTSHHPKWAIAYKFQAKQATTKLNEVFFSVGKIGTITPVALVEPTQLAGVTISMISLHNEDFIVSKDIRVGDQVLIERAGDVIPYIVKSHPELRTGKEKKVVFPKNCPSCNAKLAREEDVAAWYCPNPHCTAQVLAKLTYHVSKDAMDIDGMGERQIARFHELGWLKNFADIYRLNYDAIARLEGFGKKSADKLKTSIEKAKKNPIQRLLNSLSIHHLGQRASKLIAEQTPYVLDLATWHLQDFTAIKDIGPVVAQNIVKWFSNPDNVDILRQMESLGVNMKQTDLDRPKVLRSDGVFSGKTILFTGTLSQMGRKEAQEVAEAQGAKNISAVSSNLDILVVGENAGSKLDKAKKIGTVQILTEEEFIQLVNNP